MKLRVITAPVAVLCAAFALQGCVAAVAVAVAQAEQDRLAQLASWEAEIRSKDCAGLDQSYAKLVADKDDFVDFDQRKDFMREQYTEKSCPPPEGLAA